MPHGVDSDLLARRLAAVRRRFRLVVGFRGIAWLATLVLLGLAGAAALDWRIHLPGLARAVFLVGLLSAAGVIAYRYLLQPLRRRTDDLSLALQVEAHYPELNDCLASTVQFLQQPGESEAGGSVALRRAAVRRTLYQVEGCDFGRVVDTRGINKAAASMIFASLVAAGLVFLFPGAAATALARLANPFGDTEWPAQTRLTDLTGRTRIAQGEMFEARVALEGIIPERATVIVQPANGQAPSEKSYAVGRGEGSDTGMVVARWPTGRDHGSFRYQVRANDGATPWRDVQVLPPVKLVQLDGRPSPQTRLVFPAYTDLPPLNLADGTANIEAVVGTHVQLRAAVDRRLGRAWIEYHPDQPLVNLAAFLGPLGAATSGQALSLTCAGQQVWDHAPARLERGGLVLQANLLPRVSGTYALRLEDETGLVTTRLFDVRLLDDPAPEVNLERPSASLDSLAVLPTAEITVQVTAEDQRYAVRSVFLLCSCKDEKPRQLVLYDHRAAESLTPLLSLTAGFQVPAPRLRARPQHLQLGIRLPLRQLRHADGSELHDGDVVTLQAAATDFDDVAVDKQPGKSHEVELRIVSMGALEAQLQQDQAKIQQELLRLRERQREATRRVDAAEKQWRNTGRLRAEDVDNLIQAGELQQQVRGRIGTRQEGLRAEVARIRQTLRDNQLPRSGAHERMEMVDRELDRLAEQELAPIEPLLTEARKENELSAEPAPPEKRKNGPLTQALEHQDEVERALTQMLARLEPWSTTREVKGEARAILQEQQRLNTQLDKLGREIPRGEELKDLQPEQRAELDKAADWQSRLGEQASQLLNKMNRVANEKERLAEEKLAQAKEKARLAEQKLEESRDPKANDPDKARLQEEAQELRQEQERLKQEAALLREEARVLEQAAKLGRSRLLGDRMKSAARDISKNQLGTAAEAQKEAMQGLERLLKSLEDRREQELDRLIKNFRDAEKEMLRLQEEQDRLRKKVKEAQRIEDNDKRVAALRALAPEQEALRRQVQQLTRQLAQMRAEQAREALTRADGNMEDAGRRLGEGQEAREDHEDALEQLDEARRELQRAREDAEEELAREKLVKIADQLRRLKERQEALIPEAARIHKEVLENKQWTRAFLGSLSDLSDAQEGLGKETASLIESKLSHAIVFSRLLRGASDLMDEAAADLKDRFDKAKENAAKELNVATEEAADRQTQQLMRDAVQRIEQLLAALKPDDGVPQRPRQQQPGDKPMGGGSQREGDGIPYIAQLKALKAVQEEINRRTAEFAKQHPDAAKLTEKEQKELKRIEEEQKSVAELLQELTAPAGEGEKP
jgi:hypothetical protein